MPKKWTFPDLLLCLDSHFSHTLLLTVGVHKHLHVTARYPGHCQISPFYNVPWRLTRALKWRPASICYERLWKVIAYEVRGRARRAFRRIISATESKVWNPERGIIAFLPLSRRLCSQEHPAGVSPNRWNNDSPLNHWSAWVMLQNVPLWNIRKVQWSVTTLVIKVESKPLNFNLFIFTFKLVIFSYKVN